MAPATHAPLRDASSRSARMSESEPTSQPEIKPLWEAIKSGSLQQIEALLGDNPSLLNARDERGYTPLLWVLRQVGKGSRDRIARWLIDRGAEIDLHAACALDL